MYTDIIKVFSPINLAFRSSLLKSKMITIYAPLRTKLVTNYAINLKLIHKFASVPGTSLLI